MNVWKERASRRKTASDSAPELLLAFGEKCGVPRRARKQVLRYAQDDKSYQITMTCAPAPAPSGQKPSATLPADCKALEHTLAN